MTPEFEILTTLKMVKSGDFWMKRLIDLLNFIYSDLAVKVMILINFFTNPTYLLYVDNLR